MHRRIAQSFYRALGVLFAYCLIVPAQVAYLLGRVKTHWTPEARTAYAKGGVLLVSNHPSLIETVVLPSLFWHPAWWGDQRRIPWSFSDKYLFGDRPWIYPGCRCFPVSRAANKSLSDKQLNAKAIKGARRVLGRGGVVITHVEGGRTCKGESFWSHQGRRIRRFDMRLIKHVAALGYTIIPVWIDHGVVTEPETFGQGYKKLFLGPTFKVYFGRPLYPGDEPIIDEQRVAGAILQAGS